MQTFKYKGLDRSGHWKSGEISADNLRIAKNKLKEQGIYLQEIDNKLKTQQKTDSSFKGKAVKTKDLAVFTRLFATLLKANVPIVESLDSISQQTSDPYFASCIANVRSQIKEGKSFHEAIEKHPSVFDSIFIALCKAGEMSGKLDIVLLRLANLTEKRAALTNKVRMGLFYPGLLFFFTISIVIALFTYVIPKVAELFEDNSKLPWATKLTLIISKFLIQYWLSLLIGLIIFSFLFLKWKKTKNGKFIWDHIVLKFPVIGKILRISDISLFSRTFATLLYGGVPVLQAMDIVKNVVSNEHIRGAIQKARENIKEGESIAQPLSRSGQFPPTVIQMIRVGEKSGNLENMLEQVSDSYDSQLETEVSSLTALLEPIMIILMGCIIAFVVFSVMLPMLESFDNLGG